MRSASELPVYVYLDDDLIDEQWSFLQEKGVTEETVEEVEAALSAKFKFGLGSLLSAMFADVKSEAGTSVAGKRTTKTRITSVLRYLLLESVITPIDDIERLASCHAAGEAIGQFVRLELPKLALLPIPSMADLIKLGMLEDFDPKTDDSEAMAAVTEQLSSITNVDRTIPFMLAAKSKSKTFQGSLIAAIEDHFAEEFLNLYNLNQNDLTLALSEIKTRSGKTVVAMVCKDTKMRRTTAVHCAAEHVQVFGRCVSFKVNNRPPILRLVSVEPLAITIVRHAG